MIKLLILFEGLGFGLSPFLSSSYIERGLVPSLGVKYEQHGWLAGGVACPKEKALVVSHSFGVKQGLLFAKRCKLPLLALDSRMPPFGVGGGQAGDAKVVSFFRKGLMQGYAVDGAENVQLPGSVSHVGVPFNDQVRERARRLLQ